MQNVHPWLLATGCIVLVRYQWSETEHCFVVCFRRCAMACMHKHNFVTKCCTKKQFYVQTSVNQWVNPWVWIKEWQGSNRKGDCHRIHCKSQEMRFHRRQTEGWWNDDDIQSEIASSKNVNGVDYRNLRLERDLAWMKNESYLDKIIQNCFCTFSCIWNWSHMLPNLHKPQTSQKLIIPILRRRLHIILAT